MLSSSAVYDGHGGGKVAAHISKYLHKFILKQPEYKSGEYEKAISRGFMECDEAMRTDESLKDEMSGSTAITALVRCATYTLSPLPSCPLLLLLYLFFSASLILTSSLYLLLFLNMSSPVLPAPLPPT